MRFRTSAFTLIEVLVVVAIIALLVGILIPSLSRARENAKSATCLANGHQIGLAMRMYAQENRSLLPPQNPTWIEWLPEVSRNGFNRGFGKTGRSGTTEGKVGDPSAGQGGSGAEFGKVFYCPNDDAARNAAANWSTPGARIYDTNLYAVGYYYLGNPTWKTGSSGGQAGPDTLWIDVNRNGKTRDEYVLRYDEKLADQTIVLTCRIIPQGAREYWRFRHPMDSKNGWSNVVMGDGHAEPRSHSKAKVRWYPPRPVGW